MHIPYCDKLKLEKLISTVAKTILKLTKKEIDSLILEGIEELEKFIIAEGITKNKILCALSLFFASGGTNEFLYAYGKMKLKKWEDRL